MISRFIKALVGGLSKPRNTTLTGRTQRMKIITGGSSVTIDGKTFQGRNITIRGDKVVIDGVEQEGTLVGPISVVVNGNAQSVETSSGSVELTGTAGSVKTMSGSVSCGDVNGSVSTMSGAVVCRSVAGGVSTMSGAITGLKP